METIVETGLAPSAPRSPAPAATPRAIRPSVTLVAMSKTFDAEAIEPVIAAGQRVFGENRVQEAKAKWPALMAKHPGLELHMIGPLQSNKAKEAVALFDAIHSVDRASLCEALAKEIDRAGPRSRCCSSRSTPAPSRKKPACCRRTPMRFSRAAATAMAWPSPA